MSEALISLTATVVASYVGNNQVRVDDIPAIISSVYASFANVGSAKDAEPENKEAPKPAIAVKKSVHPDYIICLEDGKKLKMLKRHLMSSYNMTPDEYRAKWNLPSDYPMVAPNYAKARSALAMEIGLGKRKAE